MNLRLKKIIPILIIGTVLFPAVNSLAEISPTSTPDIVASASPTPSMPVPSMSTADVLKYLSDPFIAINGNESVIYAQPGQTINLTATTVNISDPSTLQWIVNGSLKGTGENISLPLSESVPATYNVQVIKYITDPVYSTIKGISQVSAHVTIRVVDADIYFYPNTLHNLGNYYPVKQFPSVNQSFTLAAIPFYGDLTVQYNWLVNGILQTNHGPILTIPGTAYTTTKNIEMRVEDANHNVVTDKNISIPIQ